MENKRFLIGSKAFFSGMEGFEPKDSDFLTLVKTKQWILSLLSNDRWYLLPLHFYQEVEEGND